MPLYPHQKRVRELLYAGKNVILQAPTGAGKTRAAIEPFMHSTEMARYGHGRYLPQKLIYSVPMRVLAKQFHVEYHKLLNTFNQKKKLELHEAVQTGDLSTDPQLHANLIFATIDQTLSSFLMTPYSLSRGRANLNLGAILSSYLVFDEFHLYDPDSTLPTVLQMLRMVNGISPFLLMTATFSEVLLNQLAELLNAEVIGLSMDERREFSNLPSQQKIRRYHTVSIPLSAEVVLAEHRSRSVVICNTVARARAMAANLQSMTSEIEILLLHSQFLHHDRNRIEDNIRIRFGKHANTNQNVILVATQVIEVGVDITSNVMHTELAPANAIIQRAGRCARYEGTEGDVFIYRYSTSHHGEIIDLYVDTNPYSGNLERPQLQRTFEVFMLCNGHNFNFVDEQTVIDTVHQETDRQVLSALGSNAVIHRNQMYAVMRGDDSGNVGSLVRNVIAQPVTIHHSPKELKNPHLLPNFSLHPSTLKGFIKTWLSHYHTLSDDTAPPFAVCYLVSETDPDDTRQRLDHWENVTFRWDEKGEMQISKIPYGALVIVHPALATYTESEGFIPEHGGEWVAPLPLTSIEKTDNNYHYRLETYSEHIRLVYKAAFGYDPAINHTAFWEEVDWAVQRLAQRLNISSAMIRQSAELTILLHDVGKLSKGWQDWVREYQTKIGNPTNNEEAYAHTDRYAPHHHDVERSMGKRRPAHAVESAVAVLGLIQDLPEVLRRPVITAISRHHGAFTSDYKPVTLERNACTIVSATIAKPVKSLLDGSSVKSFNADYLVTPDNQSLDAFFIYALLVRLLRRSDTKGTSWNSPSGGNYE